MKTRIIHTKIWTDSFYLELEPIERYLFLYFITNPHVNIIHCYECPNAIIMLETGTTKDVIEKCKVKFAELDKIHFYKNFIFLKNASRYETYSGELNERAKQKIAGEMASDVLDWYNKKTDTPIYTPLKGTITHNTEQRTHNSKFDEHIDPDSIPL